MYICIGLFMYRSYLLALRLCRIYNMPVSVLQVLQPVRTHRQWCDNYNIWNYGDH